jgi:hypothetical protein
MNPTAPIIKGAIDCKIDGHEMFRVEVVIVRDQPIIRLSGWKMETDGKAHFTGQVLEFSAPGADAVKKLIADAQQMLAQNSSVRSPAVADSPAPRRPAFTDGSKALTEALWNALGFNGPLDIPPEFAGVDWRAIEWERAGWTVDLIDAEARRIARVKPLKPLSYFEKVFATSFAKRQAPLPVVEIREAEKLTVTSYGKTQAAGDLRRAGFAGISARARYGHSESEIQRPSPGDLEPINRRRNPA